VILEKPHQSEVLCDEGLNCY